MESLKTEEGMKLKLDFQFMICYIYLLFVIIMFLFALYLLSAVSSSFQKIPSQMSVCLLHEHLISKLFLASVSLRRSVRKGVLRNFAKFTGKHLCQSLFFNKVAGLRPVALLKKRLWHRCFLVNFEKFLRTHFLPDHLRWLLLCLYCHMILFQN